MLQFRKVRPIVASLAAALAIAGCATSTDSADFETSGSLTASLEIQEGLEIDEVQWVITGGDMEPMGDTIDTSAPGATASVEVFGLPPTDGDDYTIVMTATATDGETTCEGSADFGIDVGQVTAVMVLLNCKRPTQFGSVRVNGKFNICAELLKAVVSPLQTSVGYTIDLSSQADDSEGDPVAYEWTSNSGMIADPSAASTTYLCTEAGDDDITISVSDDGFEHCNMASWTVRVTCVPSEGDLCEEVTCDDTGNECTVAECNPANGMCEESNVADGTSCDDDSGTCQSGSCVPLDLCEDVTCDDTGNECTVAECNPANGMCEESNVENGTACGDGGSCVDGECTPTAASLSIEKTGPPAAFTEQEFDFVIEVSNDGPATASAVVLVDDVPDEGSFVGSDPEGDLDGGELTIDLGDIDAGSSVTVTVTWQAPLEPTTLVNAAEASADNAPPVSDTHSVEVGVQTIVTGGVTAAGTGLRNRDNGDIVISDIPDGASVTRAVLVWALLYTSPVPSNEITFEGELITAQLTQTISANLCWGDSATIGYAADVTSLVSGNGVYAITDPVNAVIREDANPAPAFPLTDGATLFVFYGGPGFDDQVLSDFEYSARSGTGSNQRTFEGIDSTGGTATLYLAGPDGQSNGPELIRITGDGELAFDNTWDGSDPHEGPDFGIGNLWDTDIHDISSILPVGQTTLVVNVGSQGDCTGLSGVALQVEQ